PTTDRCAANPSKHPPIQRLSLTDTSEHSTCFSEPIPGATLLVLRSPGPLGQFCEKIRADSAEMHALYGNLLRHDHPPSNHTPDHAGEEKDHTGQHQPAI